MDITFDLGLQFAIITPFWKASNEPVSVATSIAVGAIFCLKKCCLKVFWPLFYFCMLFFIFPLYIICIIYFHVLLLKPGWWFAVGFLI